MRHSYFQINVKAKIQLEVVPPLIVILLAFILAISPNILLSKQIEQISDITREDLTEQQIEAIRSHGRVWKYKGIARVGDKKMADAEWSATIVDRKT